MRSFSRSLASGHETPHAHETWCVRKAANTSAGELSAVSSGTIPSIERKGSRELCGSLKVAGAVAELPSPSACSSRAEAD